jgi:hypothetical protein
MHCIASRIRSAWSVVMEAVVFIKHPNHKEPIATLKPTSTEFRQCQHNLYSDLHFQSTPRRHAPDHDAAVSTLRGLDANRSISAETSSLVLLIVRRHSLASLLGSSRPSIPLKRRRQLDRLSSS